MQVKPSLLFKTLSPKIEFGYNLDEDIIQVKKTFLGITWLRIITDPAVADTTVDKWIVYGDWAVI